MRIPAAILIGGVLIAAPAFAQDTGKDSGTAKKAETHHAVRHRTTYKRDYKTDQEEHQATEDLNKQYRGVNAADAH